MKAKKLITTVLTLSLLAACIWSCRTLPAKKTPPADVSTNTGLPNDWENPNLNSINKEPPHCTLLPYPNDQTALEGTRKASIYHQSLNGKWKFHWVSKPDDRPL